MRMSLIKSCDYDTTVEDAAARRHQVTGGHTHRSLAKLFGIVHQNIGNIVARRAYRNVK